LPFDEDCLQLNIWVPASEVPKEGWPVYFYIHGGFLQYGTPNLGNPVALISQTDCQCIVVKPAYRLGIFGFLASEELLSDLSNKDKTVGNLGFWDLRLALEWTYKNVSYFGGNASNITVGGYSAGSHCTFYQLQYDLEQPLSKRIIKRVVMQSNGTGVQPKTLTEAQLQFDELLHQLDISLNLPPKDKLSQLRKASVDDLLRAAANMRFHQFRAVLDGVFIKYNLFVSIEDGMFARKLHDANVQILMGECNQEHWVYGTWWTPAPGLSNLFERFQVDYPRKACEVLIQEYFPDGRLPVQWKTWKEAFGRIYADVQIHVTQRGFVDALIRGGAGNLVKRYRIEWRVKCADLTTPSEWGATHGSDLFLWWFGEGFVLEQSEQKIVRKALLDDFAKFLKGENLCFGTRSPLEARRLKADGSIDIWRDDWWEDRLRIWKTLQMTMLKEATAKPRL
jgi:carboxylesterase type B